MVGSALDLRGNDLGRRKEGDKHVEAAQGPRLPRLAEVGHNLSSFHRNLTLEELKMKKSKLNRKGK